MDLMKTDLDQFNGDFLPNGFDEPFYYYLSVTNDLEDV